VLNLRGCASAAWDDYIVRPGKRAVGSLVGTARWTADSVRAAVKFAATGGNYRHGDDESRQMKEALGQLGVETVRDPRGAPGRLVEAKQQQYSEALDRAQQRISAGDDFGAGAGFTEEFTAPTAGEVITILEGGKGFFRKSSAVPSGTYAAPTTVTSSEVAVWRAVAEGRYAELGMGNGGRVPSQAQAKELLGRLKAMPDKPGVYHVEARGEYYTGSGVDVRDRVSNVRHPAADLFRDPEATIEFYPADISAAPATRKGTNRALRVVEQDVMDAKGNVPKQDGSRNRGVALTEPKRDPYRQEYKPTLGDPEEY
jgi:hypothetical protein